MVDEVDREEGREGQESELPASVKQWQGTGGEVLTLTSRESRSTMQGVLVLAVHPEVVDDQRCGCQRLAGAHDQRAGDQNVAAHTAPGPRPREA